jgi:hypothetical protein
VTAARSWVDAPGRTDDAYGRAYSVGTDRRPKGAKAVLDVYRARDGAGAQPLLVFQHIRKTAGTSFRHVLHSNLAKRADLEVLPCFETRDWFRELWETAAGRDRIVALAGHSANLVLPFVDRPVLRATIVREPVDRVMSRYYFGGSKSWRLESAFDRYDAASAKTAFFCNGQARSLLDPHMDLSSLPRLADGPGADAWRERLRALVDGYLLGVQERFEESLRVFARELRWDEVYVAATRVNRARPAVAELPEATRQLIAEHNWLDTELHGWALARL